MSEMWANEDASTTEALFDARNYIEELEEANCRKGMKVLALAVENMALVERADEELGGRYLRLMDAVLAIEHFASNMDFSGLRSPVGIIPRLLQDAIDYGESGQRTELLASAIEAAEHSQLGEWEDVDDSRQLPEAQC